MKARSTGINFYTHGRKDSLFIFLYKIIWINFLPHFSHPSKCKRLSLESLDNGADAQKRTAYLLTTNHNPNIDLIYLLPVSEEILPPPRPACHPQAPKSSSIGSRNVFNIIEIIGNITKFEWPYFALGSSNTNVYIRDT